MAHGTVCLITHPRDDMDFTFSVGADKILLFARYVVATQPPVLFIYQYVPVLSVPGQYRHSRYKWLRNAGGYHIRIQYSKVD